MGLGPWSLPLLLFVSCTFLTFGESQFPSTVHCAYFQNPRELVADAMVQYIKIPTSGRGYLPNQHCEWQIKTAFPDQVIQLYIIDIDLEGRGFYKSCQRDYLDIYDVRNDKNVEMDRVCGESSNLGKKLFETKSTKMMLQFIANTQYEFEGFRLSYMAVPKPKEKESDDSSIVAIIVGIMAVAVFGIVCSVLFVMHRKWQKRRCSQRHNPESHRNAPELAPHPVAPESNARRQSNSRQPYLSTTRASHSVQDMPLQVFIPDMTWAQSQAVRGGRSESPPPSYDYLVQHDGMVEPQNMTMTPPPLSPPDYETVIKIDAEAQANRESNW